MTTHPEAVKLKRLITHSPLHIIDRNFKELALSTRFEALLGTPATNFSSIIYGRANQGKSPFAVQLAQELARFGRVLYISSEELISKSLKDRLILNKIDNKLIRFAPVRKADQIERLIKGVRPRHIIIDSVQICKLSFDDFLHLKQVVSKNRRGFHLVSQTTNNGKPLLEQRWFHEVDAKISVDKGQATCVSRFKSSGHMVVYDSPKANPELFDYISPPIPASSLRRGSAMKQSPKRKSKAVHS